MKVSEKDVLLKLGSGETPESVRDFAGLSIDEFQLWWDDQLKFRLPDMKGTRSFPNGADVEIFRDVRGVPHIYAKTEDDLFFGYGFAMAQDRLWQLDYCRRKATGSLSEVLGPDGLELDIIARTVGINRIAEAEIKLLSSQALGRLESFARGINLAMIEANGRLPIEFALLDYQPDPWSVLDTVAIWGEFRWYLTGRLPVIALPEIAKRKLGEGPLYQAFLTSEAGDESILNPGSYKPGRPTGGVVGEVVGDPHEGQGSNNWVVGPNKSTTGKPLVASDPHIAFGSVSCWYEVHLSGAGFNVAGGGYVGVPGIIFGRNERVGWGVTNNICSQRDLYQERTDAQHPGCFLYDVQWVPWKEITEEITIKGGDTFFKTVRLSHNGPIVDELLPQPSQDTGPVSLRWLGTEFSDEISCILAMNKAGSTKEFRDALSSWQVPTWSLVFADIDGHIGYQCVGNIPIRKGWDRGYRQGWNPKHQWDGLVPITAMPTMNDPPEGWIRSANNRTAPDDYPYPLSGTWATGHRARRVREMLEEKEKLSAKDFARMQMDTKSMRAVEGVPHLLDILSLVSDERMQQAASLLKTWDYYMKPDSTGAAIFETFFSRWLHRVAAERFDNQNAVEIAGAIGGLSLELLSKDQHGWFKNGNREEAIVATACEVIDDLSSRLGDDMVHWTWGDLHKIDLKHYLDDRGGAFGLVRRGGIPVGGSGTTVCNTGYDPTYMAAMGANFRIVADLAESPAGLWAVDAAGQSGSPGSPNYCDQLPEWTAGRLHHVPLDRKRVEAESQTYLILKRV